MYSNFLFYRTVLIFIKPQCGTITSYPERIVHVLAGDDGFQFTMAELGTLCQEKLKILIIVFNDHRFGEFV